MKLQLIIVLALIFLFTVSHEAQAQSKNISSVEEDLELEMQLKILNKPPIKSFKKNGVIIDCIDIYKQPAFDHPLLKNHTLQMRPSVLPEGLKPERKDASELTGQSDSEFSSCPSGTVPFKRVVKEDLIRAKAALDLVRLRNKLQQFQTGELYYGIVTTAAWRNIHGARGEISLYNLTNIKPPQISEALIWLGSNTDGPYNSIESGWTVNPQLYGDTQTHSYTLWTADGFDKTGCYNALCPGFVQVSKEIIMGDVLSLVTIPGERVRHIAFSIFNDPNKNNWWIFANLPDGDKPIGYWPKGLLPSMAESAGVVQLGGKAYSPLAMGSPQLGSGTYLEDDFKRTCFVDRIQFVNSNNQYYKPTHEQMLATSSHDARAKYLGDLEEIGCTMIFGGPDVH